MSMKEFSDELKRLNNALFSIADKAKIESNKLMMAYAMENAAFNINDIIDDGRVIIIIDKILWSSGEQIHNFRGKVTHRNTVEPFCVYIGRELTKKLTLKKSGDTCRVIKGRKLDLSSEQRLALTNK